MILRYNILSILWAAFILVLSVTPGDRFPDLDHLEIVALDKMAHVFLYSVLVFLLTTGLKRQYSNAWLRYHAKLSAFWIGLFYGLLMEITQLLLHSDRSFEVFDLLANGVGCIIGVIAFLFVYGKELAR